MEQKQTLVSVHQFFERNQHVIKPVRLNANSHLTLEPGQSVKLLGHLPENSKVSGMWARTDYFLPKGLRIENMSFDDNTVKLGVINTNSRKCVSLSNSTVLAELDAPVHIECIVGPAVEVQVSINQNDTSALLDTGSQVTIISESFYQSKLSALPLRPLDGTLNVIGAGGQSVPYLGAIFADLTLPESSGGHRGKVAMLVGRDTPFSLQTPVIVGTNAFKNMNTGEMAKISIEARLAATKQLQHESSLGSFTLKENVKIPSHSSVLVKCSFHGKSSVFEQLTHVLVQEPTKNVLSDELGIVAKKMAVHELFTTKIEIANFSDSVQTLKKGCEIADVFAIKCEYDIFDVLDQIKKNDGCTGSSVHNASHVKSENLTSEKTDLDFKFGENAPHEWKKSFSAKLQSYKDVFICNDLDLGYTNEVLHDVLLEPGPYVPERCRPIPPADYEDCKNHIKELLDANIISPVSSPYSSPIVLVRKKSGALRLCIDYRRINLKTVKCNYPLPKIEDLFTTLSGARVFSQMDLAKAYYQVGMTERAKKISAFVTPFGTFQFERMPMGMKNSPQTFSRLMGKVFADMDLVDLIVFLDDILVHGQTYEQLEERTLAALDRLRRFNLKLDPEKCIFGTTEVRHLGHVISEAGIKPDPAKTSALKDWPIPKTIKEVKGIVGFLSYWRRFLPHFAQRIKPLNDLTLGYVPGKKRKKSHSPSDKSLSLTSDITHLWGSDQQLAFDDLKKALTSEPIITIADRSKPFELHCDASGTGIGSMLCQYVDGVQKVVAYASRSLTKSERNYPAHKREFLALKWSLADKFHDYVYGGYVTVITDNNPLTYILKNAKLDATSHRWLASLSVYNFDLKYKKGTHHIVPDALSRKDTEPPENDPEYAKILENTEFLRKKAQKFEDNKNILIDRDTVCAMFQVKGVVCERQAVYDPRQTVYDPNKLIPAVESLVKDPDLLSEDILQPSSDSVDTMSNSEWRDLQLADRNLAYVYHCVKYFKTIDNKFHGKSDPELNVYAREQDKLTIKNNVLYRLSQGDDEKMIWQLVIPKSHRAEAMQGVHDDLYHVHYDSALSQARLRFFWPFMARDLHNKITKCMRCIHRGARQQKASMLSIETTYPLELLSIDYLTIEEKGKKINLLVCQDHFTKFSQSIITKDQTAKSVAKALWNEFFLLYGFPSKIISDQGRDFESKLVKELCQLAGIQKCRTTPYHPSGNCVERWNRTLISMIRSLENDKKTEWRKHLKAIVHAYNSRIHESTGFSPYFLFFGRHPKLPVDLAFGINVNEKSVTPRQYIQNLKDSLKSAYDKAKTGMDKSASKNKRRYDLSAHAADLEVGDRCLVRKMGPLIKSKVDDRWEENVYKVIARKENFPVYTVQLETGDGPCRTLHRNLLLPLGMIGADPEPPLNPDRPKHDPRPKPVPRPRRKIPVPVQQDTSEYDECELQIQMEPDPRLRVNAPLFTPTTPQPVPIISNSPVQSPVSESESSDNETKFPVNQIANRDSDTDVSSKSAEIKPKADSEQTSDSEEESDTSKLNESTDLSSITQGQTKSKKSSCEKNKTPVVRRSLRKRKAVQKLNLLHQVKSDNSVAHLIGALHAVCTEWMKDVQCIKRPM